jgi:hypothetical protein
LFYLLSAETPANSEGIIQGLTDTELSNIGYLQSQALGKHLQYHRFSHIYASDLKRATEVCPFYSFHFLSLRNKVQVDFFCPYKGEIMISIKEHLQIALITVVFTRYIS